MSHVSAFHITCNAGYELNLEARLNGNPHGQSLASKLVAGETIDVDLKDRAKKGDTVSPLALPSLIPFDRMEMAVSLMLVM